LIRTSFETFPKHAFIKDYFVRFRELVFLIILSSGKPLR